MNTSYKPTPHEVARVLAWEIGWEDGRQYALRVSAQMGVDSQIYREAADLLQQPPYKTIHPEEATK